MADTASEHRLPAHGRNGNQGNPSAAVRGGGGGVMYPLVLCIKVLESAGSMCHGANTTEAFRHFFSAASQSLQVRFQSTWEAFADSTHSLLSPAFLWQLVSEMQAEHCELMMTTPCTYDPSEPGGGCECPVGHRNGRPKDNYHVTVWSANDVDGVFAKDDPTQAASQAWRRYPIKASHEEMRLLRIYLNCFLGCVYRNYDEIEYARSRIRSAAVYGVDWVFGLFGEGFRRDAPVRAPDCPYTTRFPYSAALPGGVTEDATYFSEERAAIRKIRELAGSGEVTPERARAVVEQVLFDFVRDAAKDLEAFLHNGIADWVAHLARSRPEKQRQREVRACERFRSVRIQDAATFATCMAQVYSLHDRFTARDKDGWNKVAFRPPTCLVPEQREPTADNRSRWAHTPRTVSFTCAELLMQALYFSGIVDHRFIDTSFVFASVVQKELFLSDRIGKAGELQLLECITARNQRARGLVVRPPATDPPHKPPRKAGKQSVRDA
jgi:hypothetical protein